MADHFDVIADSELRALEKALGDMDPDEAEVDLSQGVLTLTFSDGQKCIINSHHAAGQIWMAAFRQAWHFSPDEKSGVVTWRTEKDELRQTLKRVLEGKLGHPIAL